MIRFDSEAQLQTHVLGGALLLMLRDDNAGLEMPAHRMQFEARVNPFDAIRSRLSALDFAFQGLQPHVQLAVVCPSECTIAGMRMAAFAMAVVLLSALWLTTPFKCKQWFHIILCPPRVVVVCVSQCHLSCGQPPYFSFCRSFFCHSLFSARRFLALSVCFACLPSCILAFMH